MTKWTTAYRELFVLTSLVILLPTLVGALCWREFVWFPLGLLATHWLVLFFILRDHANAAQSPRILRLIFWLLPVTALIGGAVLALLRSGFDAYALIVTILYLSFGLMFLVLGNILPKVRQNNTIGIKIKWTLENEQNWNATHRFSGRLWVIGGILCMACALVAESAIAMVVFFVCVLALAILPMGYSYRYYRRQLASGSIAPSPVSRKGAAFVVLFIIALCAFTGWTLFSGSMSVNVDDNALTIETKQWKDLTIPYSEIDSLTYYDHDPSANSGDVRTNGFGNLRFSMGKFQNDLYGSYTRYTHASCDAVIVLEANDGIIVLNGADESATRMVYEQLLENVE